MKKIISYTVIPAIATLLPAMPIQAQEIVTQQAASQVEQAIQEAMPHAEQGNGPTLGQLGGVQAGATDFDAGVGAGGDGSSGGGSSGGSGGCFAPGTLVLMADGTSKPIKDLVIGDKVASWDFASESQVPATVSYVYHVQRDYHFLLDGIQVTAEHPFCIGIGQFSDVQSLVVGDKIAEVIEDKLGFVSIQQHQKVDQAGTFHNMTVLPTNMYIVKQANQVSKGGWLVHNSKSGGSD